ncbi:precorrin-6y C5,15-methyltransferase (decarboxylating) subunit CbiE [Pelagibius litoralis]|uniref:Precorrin-6y C5,15-methyltransferase (Decarboxylating) subunit CbiE n=1 Tax=Pelagibius litoralis TaxID=374515 RepID=A0A967C9J6_9PROT|nr:precorrin-6y C5,15-methyltransferase (decarboxylating) subunit CbiE [Pelagibius litoralis]NIA69157.1 precorrin-6y C5,15-methyltransferase (decarboxylating) subunit CbiE [Pelagibius litoralis]
MSAASKSAPWLSLVGIGEDGLAGLTPTARRVVDDAEVLVGGERHLAMVPEDGRERLAWPSPLATLLDEIAARRGTRVCVLATGDPLWYGIGVSLLQRIPRDEMTILPGLSAFASAAARLGWPLAEVETLTLHGRPLALLQSYLQPGARLLILSEGAETPGAVAALLRERGYGGSRMVVLEHMDGAAERRIDGTADDWRANDIAALNTLAIDCVAGPDAALLPRVPGLPDEAFRHDGQMTKREMRAVTLAALAPLPGQLLWDVGAGCGSVSVEWMRAAPRGRAIAVERKAERLTMIAENAEALGTPALEIVDGEAPAALAGLEAPDAVFIGGGASGEGVIETCWQALKEGGRLVANAVTLEGEQALLAWQKDHGGALSRLAVSRAEPVGPFQGWRPMMPVTHYSHRKTFAGKPS